MIKNWNQRVDIKIDGRIVGIHFIDAQKFNPEMEVWEILTGIIHMNVSEYGKRPTDKHVGRFEARFYDGNRLDIHIKPGACRVTESMTSFTNPFKSHDGTNLKVEFDWIRQQIANTWMEIWVAHGNSEKV